MRERRNVQRMTVEIGELAVLPVHMSVRVLDISLRACFCNPLIQWNGARAAHSG